ncbi:MAG: hypothetical protein COW85_03520 [Ignavibacteria bacterium CG22_combo_CG10-13_8_21_14_all_37_15]|nr:MAG: hypothetical protein COW85_03520 [Ignavibacteria bacterium CG22_combo_CG10-13_8_21_14_all_37_15]
MRLKKALSVIVLMVAIFPLGIFCQSFTASTSSTKVDEGEQFEVTFTYSGTEMNSIGNFQPPNFNSFLILSGPNQSSNMQIINGAVSGSRAFTYYLQPRSVGKFTIGSAAISVKGQTLKSDPLPIEVVKGGTPQQSKKTQGGQDVSSKEISENVFIRALVDKNSVYQGEQVTVTYKLYTRLNIQSPQVSKLPSYQGFWSEEIETSNQITFARENYEGKVFNVAVLKRAALFPTQTGELSVTPFELKIPVLVQRKKRSNSPFDNFFDDPFLGRTESVEYTAKSNTVKVKVLPLPQTTLSSFTGAVGDYTLQTSVDKKIVRQNEPVTLKVMVSGEGNINLLDPPQMQIPNGFEKYEPKISTNVSRGGVISGKKNFELLVIPRVSGNFEIHAMQFTFFNPRKKIYQTESSPAYQIIVEQGSAEYSGGTSGLSKEEIKLLSQDIRFIKTDFSDVTKKIKPVENSLLVDLGLYSLPLLVLLGFLFWKQKQEKLSGNITLLKNLRAEKIAKARLKTAAKYLKEQNDTLFFAEISLAVYGYLEDKLSINKADFTVEAAISRLLINEVDEDMIAEMRFILEKCEFVRFAPSQNILEDMNLLYKRTAALIALLEAKILLKRGTK